MTPVSWQQEVGDAKITRFPRELFEPRADSSCTSTWNVLPAQCCVLVPLGAVPREGWGTGQLRASRCPRPEVFHWAASPPCRNACMEFLWNNPAVWCPQGCFCCDCPCPWMLSDPSRLSMLLHRMNYRGNVCQTHLAMEITSLGLDSSNFLCLRTFRTQARDLTGVLPPCAQFPARSKWDYCGCGIVCGQRNCEGPVVSAEGSSRIHPGVLDELVRLWQGPSDSTKGLRGQRRPLLTVPCTGRVWGTAQEGVPSFGEFSGSHEVRRRAGQECCSGLEGALYNCMCA